MSVYKYLQPIETAILDECIFTTDSNSSVKCLMPSDTDFTMSFDCEINKAWTIQVVWTGFNGNSTIDFFQSNDGYYYDEIMDNTGTALTLTLSGASGSDYVNNFAVGGLKVLMNYDSGTNTTGTFFITLVQG